MERGTTNAYVCKTILQLYTTLLYIEGVKSGYRYMQANVQYYYTYDWLRGTYIVDYIYIYVYIYTYIRIFGLFASDGLTAYSNFWKPNHLLPVGFCRLVSAHVALACHAVLRINKSTRTRTMMFFLFPSAAL